MPRATAIPVSQFRTMMAVKRNAQRRRKTPIEQAREKMTRERFVMAISELGEACVAEYQFHPKRKWRFDYAITSRKIAIEVEGGVFSGGRHIRPRGFLGDIEKYNTAALMGWRLFRVIPEELFSAKFMRLITEAVRYDYRQEDLRCAPADDQG